ncbi:MAG: hypothetical protein ACAI37_07595 [Chthoniobacter sp.]
MKKTILDRPEDLEFELSDGSSFIVKPYTRAQLRWAIALDPKPGEPRTPARIGEQRAQQLAALVGPTVFRGGTALPSADVLAALTPDEEMQILAAIMAQGHGQDPASAVALHQMVKKKGILASLVASAISTPTPSSSPTSSAAP